MIQEIYPEFAAEIKANEQKFKDVFKWCDNFNINDEMNKINPNFYKSFPKSEKLNNFYKIKLIKDKKEPVAGTSWKTEKGINDDYIKKIYKDIEPNYNNNVGILTGRNNLIIIDIDVKDEGLKNYNDYIEKNGIINTFTVKTPCGGYHLYFNSTSKNDKDNKTIKDKIKNTIKYRGVGIDVRCGNGYAVAPGSVFNDKIYYIYNDSEIVDIPSNFLNWITEDIKPATEKEEYNDNDDIYDYEMTDEQFKAIINQLENEYNNDVKLWSKITAICKYHNKFNIWDEWSQKSEKYNKIRNIKMWRNSKLNLDINYICKILEIKQIKKHKIMKYNEVKNAENYDYIEYNNKYVFDTKYDDQQYDYNLFNTYDTTILKSCPGSGKTTAVARHVEEYLKENPNTKFLSIVDRISLAQQHLQSFKNLDVKSYTDKKINFLNCRSLVCCINSLEKLITLTKEEKQEYIIFIDEITSFLNLTHNKLLDKNIKNIYNLLMSLIKNAKKVIVADAIIMENVFEFLKLRNEEQTKPLYISNNYLKFKNIKAVKVNDENNILNKIIEQCQKNDPFLFGSDSATKVTEWYNICLSKVPATEHHKFLLLTAHTGIIIKDAEKEFKDKFVFYSPTITYGVDFSIEKEQNVYIYQEGKSILPNGSYQQATRCRNIKTLYFYSVDVENFAKYKSIEDTKNKLKESVKYHNTLINVSSVYDERTEDYKIIENSFFNLYTFSEYFIDTYKTGMACHFIKLLSLNGFVVTEEGEKIKLSAEMKQMIKNMTTEIKETLFNEYVEILTEIKKINDDENIEAEQKAEEQTKKLKYLYQNKFLAINKSIEFLNIPKDNEILELYKNEITNKYHLQDHLNIIRTLRSNEYINKKIELANINSYDVKNMTLIYNKIKFIRQFEEDYKIKPLEVDYINEGDVEMNDKQYNYIKNIFRISQKKPETYEQLKRIYISMLRNITNNNLIQSKQGTKKEERNVRYYNINEDVIKYHLKLNEYSNPDKKHFNDFFKKKYDIEEAKIKFIDDEENFNDFDVDEMVELLDIII